MALMRLNAKGVLLCILISISRKIFPSFLSTGLQAKFIFFDISPFLSELKEDQITFRQGTTLEEIKSSENPVLMWVKFKD
jgi:hypothetical protein